MRSQSCAGHPQGTERGGTLLQWLSSSTGWRCIRAARRTAGRRSGGKTSPPICNRCTARTQSCRAWASCRREIQQQVPNQQGNLRASAQTGKGKAAPVRTWLSADKSNALDNARFSQRPLSPAVSASSDASSATSRHCWQHSIILQFIVNLHVRLPRMNAMRMCTSRVRLSMA
jgi:hypothetical protein